MHPLAGKFIVFDGGEGCGKSTQARLVLAQLDALRVPALLVRDPGTTRIGEMVRAILLDPQNSELAMRCEMLLYMAARAQMMAEVILPALKQGKTVLSDRFVSSTLAYQLGGDGLTGADIRAVADVAIHGRWPDLTILLDMPAEKSLERVRPKFSSASGTAALQKDRIEQRPLEYHQRVRENYLAQARTTPERYRIIAADRSVDEVHSDVTKALASL